jgi:DNA-binding transcriptional LysR family regulator
MDTIFALLMETGSMNVRQLECFHAVMVTGKMIRAAEYLQISQPSVSNLISNLEREIGFLLFKRRKGHLEPTPESKLFYADAVKSLESFKKAARTADEISNKRFGTLEIISYPGIAINFLPTVVAEFLRDRPDVRIRLQSRSIGTVNELLASQQFDLGIMELVEHHPAVSIEPFRGRCVCVLPPDHPLIAHEVITPKLLNGVPFIGLFSQHLTSRRLATVFSAANAKWNVVLETQYFSSACSLVKHGLGVSLIDPVTASDYADRGIVFRPFKPGIFNGICIVSPTDRQRSRLAEEFVRTLKAGLMRHFQIGTP